MHSLNSKTSLKAFALGLALAAVVSLVIQAIPESQAGGGWACYVTDRFPDTDSAREWKGAVKMTQGLNAIASHAPSGQLLVVELPVVKGNIMGGYGGSQGAPSVVCVKK